MPSAAASHHCADGKVYSTLTRPATFFLPGCVTLVSRLCHTCVTGNFLRPVWSCEALENFKLQWLAPVCMSCPSSCLCHGEGKTKTHHSTKLAPVIEARTCKDPRRSTLKSAAPRSIQADGTKMVRKCTAAQVHRFKAERTLQLDLEQTVL